MNSERIEDQATDLRDMFHHQSDKQIEHKENNSNSNIDILNLPPRKEVHSNTGRAHVKMNTSLIRFLFVLLLLTSMIIGAYYIGIEFYF